MAREVAFPRTRHLALSSSGQVEEAKAAGSEAILVPIRVAADQQAAPAPRELPWLVEVDVAAPAGEADQCRSADGAPAPVRCASSLEGRQHASDAAAKAASLGDAVLLAGLDRWYALGPEAAGYCRSCELSLIEHLRENYGEHMAPFDALAALRTSTLPPRERPFAGQKEAVRFADAVEAGKGAALRARDQARSERGMEMMVLGRVGPLGGLALELCRHLDGLVFELQSLDPMAELAALLSARAALGQRPAVAMLPATASVAQVRLFAALAAACDANVVLSPGAPAGAVAALARHRSFLSLLRERYRPSQPLVDAEVLVSPRCDHWTQGAHLRAVSLAVAALAQAQLQPSMRLDLGGGAKARLLVLAGAGALSEADAHAARRHVEQGGDALVVGPAMPADDEGRTGPALFAEVKSGLDRVGEGRVYALDQPAGLPRALRELMAGRGRSNLTLAGRGKLWARAYLDPERKLDVHLVNLDLREPGFVSAQGMQAQIAGQAAGGGRSGYWFSPERAGGKDGERITLNPSGFSVSTILPSIDAYALLAVPR
ncbi:MAG TPA: hypothetical protein VLW85_19655 [Myxococcales bacterium]|nr:hypothetical protein [Myxococcales bacterium]